MYMFLVFFNFFIWSTSFTLGKKTLLCAPPVFLTGARMFLSGIIILAFLFFAKRTLLKVKKAHILPLILLALSSVYLTNVFEFWGLQYLTAAKACFIYSLTPFLAALFSYLQFKEKITWRKLLGLVIGFVGILPVLMNQSGSENLLGGIACFSWAELSLVMATIASVYGWVLLRKLGKDNDISPLMANGFSMFLGGIFALVHSLFVDRWSPTPITNYSGFFQGVFLMILISNLICYNLYGWLLKRFTATFLSFAGLSTTIFAAFFGWLVLHESVPISFFISLGVISVGLWFVYEEELRLGYIRKSSTVKDDV